MMLRPVRTAQVYGYIVCLVTVVTFLFSIRPLIGSLFDLSDPLHAGGFCGIPSVPSYLTSFQAFKMEKLKYAIKKESQSPLYYPEEQDLKRMYEAEKADRIASACLEAKRTLTGSILTMLACVVIFATHWTWLRRMSRNDGGVVGRSTE